MKDRHNGQQKRNIGGQASVLIYIVEDTTLDAACFVGLSQNCRDYRQRHCRVPSRDKKVSTEQIHLVQDQ